MKIFFRHVLPALLNSMVRRFDNNPLSQILIEKANPRNTAAAILPVNNKSLSVQETTITIVKPILSTMMGEAIREQLEQQVHKNNFSIY